MNTQEILQGVKQYVDSRDAAVVNGLKEGSIVPKLSFNLGNWEDRDALSVEDKWTDKVRTTAGDQSINSAAGAKLVSITPLTDFYAESLKVTGFNLLRNAVAVGSGYYFLVPKLAFGQYGTALEPNGVLFTDSEGENLKPTVRFKALTAGLPASVNDGSACAYTDSNGYRFFTTGEPGYIIVSGITLAETCAHIGWSRRYDDYVAVDDAGDAGSTVALATIIHAVHDFDLLLTATRNMETVADGIAFGTSQATWTRRVNRVQPTWTDTESEGGYLHEAIISDMMPGGIVECDGIELSVNGTTVSYTDNNATATGEWVKYELATPATGNVTMSNTLAIEDWGLEMLTGATGDAEVTTQYAQSYPDAVANLINGGYQQRTQELEAQIEVLKGEIENIGAQAEGYVRVAGSSSPALSYKHYTKGNPGGFGNESVSSLFYPCLIGTKLSGNDDQVGKIKVVLKKLGLVTDDGVAKWRDLDGNLHAIDGSEGDVMVTNIQPYHAIFGKYTLNGTTFDVFLTNPTAFTWMGIESEEIPIGGDSPDFCVSHQDTDNVVRMHSVYNPSWDGSYSAPDSVVGKFVYSQDAVTGEITETYDADETLLGGAGGLHSTDIDLPTGEQQAMNQNADTTKTVPFMNHTARSAELFWANMLAEGGTFDAHNSTRMGSGFCTNDGATNAADWEESASAAKNGVRLVDRNGALMYFGLGTDAKAWTGKSSAFYLGQMVNAWRNPFRIMEAHRAVSYAVQKGIGELQWFVFEGNKYKWRSVPGFAGPAQGEMTCVVWKILSTKAAANVLDPTDKETSIEGNRIDFLFSVALYHGRTTQVSPSWWTSGMIMTEHADGHYECYIERDQAKLIKSETGDKNEADSFSFESAYKHVGTFAKGSGYRKNYSKDAFMLPDSEASKSGAGLHTYVGAYNWLTGTAPASGKKLVRGFRRGYNAHNGSLSPLTMNGNPSPAITYSYIAFGTCVRVVTT